MTRCNKNEIMGGCCRVDGGMELGWRQVLYWERIGDHDLPRPEQRLPQASVYDLITPADFVLWPAETQEISIGWRVDLPLGHVGMIVGTDIYAEKWITVNTSVIGIHKCTEIKVVLTNMTAYTRKAFVAGDILAQLVIVPCPDLLSRESGKLPVPNAPVDGGVAR